MPHPTAIDITNMPELARIAEEVAATKTPLELRRENKTVAVITPVTGGRKAKKPTGKTKADYEAFKAAAGSWKDVDTDKLVKDISAARRGTNNQEQDIWAHYEPKRVRQALAQSAGTLAGVNRGQLLRDLRLQRSQDERNRPS